LQPTSRVGRPCRRRRQPISLHTTGPASTSVSMAVARGAVPISLRRLPRVHSTHPVGSQAVRLVTTGRLDRLSSDLKAISIGLTSTAARFAAALLLARSAPIGSPPHVADSVMYSIALCPM